MQVWEVILLSFGGTSVALATVALLFKKLLGHWFNKNLEQYKLTITQENNIALEKLGWHPKDRLENYINNL